MATVMLVTIMLVTNTPGTAKAAMATGTSVNEMPAGTYTLDITHASLIWKVSHLGLSEYTARFTDFDSSIEFNPDSLAKSKVTATIDPASVETDYPYPEKEDFDKKLAEDEKWFNRFKFPSITFKSTGIEMTGEDKGKMSGTLTFLGVSKPVTLNVVFNGAMAVQPFSKKPTLGFSASGWLNRSEWGLSTNLPGIGDEVEILIEAEFAKQE